MAQVEFEAHDLEHAIAKAAAALSLPPEKVKFSVKSMGSKGFFGLWKRKARIGVDPDDPCLSLKDDEDHYQPRGTHLATQEKGSKNREKTPKGPKFKDKPETDGSKELKKNRSASQSRSRGDSAPLGKEASRPQAAAASGEKERFLPPQREAPRPGELKLLDWSHLPPPLTLPATGEVRLEGTVDQAGELALSTAKEVLSHMGFEAKINPYRLSSRIILAFESQDTALLIGAKGVTLEALQLLVNKIVAKKIQERNVSAPADFRVVLDAGDYRLRRREFLLETVQKAAGEARLTQKPQLLPALNSEDRRLVQMALRPFKEFFISSGKNRDALTISTFPLRHRKKFPGGRS